MALLSFTPQACTTTSTKILIGSNSIESFDKLIDAARSEDYVIVFDRAVASVAKRIAQQCKDPLLIPVKSGDASKSMKEADRIIDVMLQHHCCRQTLLIAVGGGMITDLGGFVASVFMRGIPCILVPTTSLAMVDAAIGGKTAVNCKGRKNMIGTTQQPLGVIADTDILQTLPMQQFCEGLAEVVKIAAITDAKFFAWLEASMDAILQRRKHMLEECVTRAIQAKIAVVQRDERDHSDRQLLNFGHTIGHAVEAYSKYKLSHGQAISIGMTQEMRLVHFRSADRVMELLYKIDMPLELPRSMWTKKKDLWKLMQTDKKNVGGNVRISVPTEIGKGEVRGIERAEWLNG